MALAYGASFLPADHALHEGGGSLAGLLGTTTTTHGSSYPGSMTSSLDVLSNKGTPSPEGAHHAHSARHGGHQRDAARAGGGKRQRTAEGGTHLQAAAGADDLGDQGQQAWGLQRGGGARPAQPDHAEGVGPDDGAAEEEGHEDAGRVEEEALEGDEEAGGQRQHGAVPLTMTTENGILMMDDRLSAIEHKVQLWGHVPGRNLRVRPSLACCLVH